MQSHLPGYLYNGYITVLPVVHTTYIENQFMTQTGTALRTRLGKPKSTTGREQGPQPSFPMTHNHTILSKKMLLC